jgi:hypothetical protein
MKKNGALGRGEGTSQGKGREWSTVGRAEWTQILRDGVERAERELATGAIRRL